MFHVYVRVCACCACVRVRVCVYAFVCVRVRVCVRIRMYARLCVISIAPATFTDVDGHPINEKDFKWEVLKAKKNPCCVPGSQSVLFPNTYACAPASGQQFARATNKKHEEIEGMANSMFDLQATFSNRNVTLLAKFDTLNMFHMK